MTTADDVKANMAKLTDEVTAETNQRKAFVLYVQGVNARLADVQSQLDTALAQQPKADPDLDAINQQLLALIDSVDGNTAAEAAAMNTDPIPTIHTRPDPVVAQPAPAGGITPKIVSISPTSGAAGTEITISGSGFTNTEAVTIGGVAVPSTDIHVADDNTIKVIAPAAAGVVSVTTGQGTSTDQVAFSNAAPEPEPAPVTVPDEPPVIEDPVLPDPVVPAPADTSGTTTTGLTAADKTT